MAERSAIPTRHRQGLFVDGVKKLENIERALGFIFSRSGFTKEADEYCKTKGIACSEDERWLESGKLKSPLV